VSVVKLLQLGFTLTNID